MTPELLHEDNCQVPYSNTGLWCRVMNKGRLSWREGWHVASQEPNEKTRQAIREQVHSDLTKLFNRYGLQVVLSGYCGVISCFQSDLN